MTEIFIETKARPDTKILSAKVEENEAPISPINGRKRSWAKVANFIILVILTAALPITIFLVQQKQEVRKKAVEPPPTYLVSVPVLSLRFFPTKPCYNPTQKITLTGATASSNRAPMYPSNEPKYAIDGSSETKWMPQTPYAGTYFLIDLGSTQTLRDISLFFWYIDRPQQYHLDVSQSGSFTGEQTRIITETNSLEGFYQMPGSSLERKDYVFDSVQARFIKLTIDAYRTGTTNESGQVNLYEFEVYANAEQKNCLDTQATGDVGITSNPAMADPLSEIRARVSSYNQNIIQTIKEGSRFHGYKDTSAISSLGHSLFEDKEFLSAIPRSNNKVPWSSTTYRPDYFKILNDLNICNYVDNLGIKEVWIWGYHFGDIEPVESNMAMGNISSAYWNFGSYGDVSNSEHTNDLPICNKTYVLYNFVYGSSSNNAVHNYLHQIENELGFADREMFWDMFVGRQYQFAGPRRCGHSHTPPNSSLDYSYSDQNYESSDCEDWTAVNCLDLQKGDPCGGTRETFNCAKWNCEELKYYLWWMQNLPGKDNNLMSGGQKVRNWWEFLSDFDAALQIGKSLTSPLLTPTPIQTTAPSTPTPTPVPGVPTPTPTAVPSGTVTVSSINMTYTGKGQNFFITTKVTVNEEGTTIPVPVGGATVALTITKPNGTKTNYSSTTKQDGVVSFGLKSKEKGTYTAIVTAVTKTGYTYRPTNITGSITIN